MKRPVFTLGMACGMLVMFATMVFAEPADISTLSERLDKYPILLNTVWVLVTAFLVFRMQAGFA